jgi:ACT domain-containing protein
MSTSQLEATIDDVVRAVCERLADSARLDEHGNPELTRLVAREVVSAIVSDGGDITQPHDNPLALGRKENGRSRAVITSSGKNRRGVVAAVATEIAKAGGDIQDMSQTIVADFFTMIMLVDISMLDVSFVELKTMLQQAAQDGGFDIRIMHEDVLRALQRV